jgi:hypothetical protein
MAGIYSYDYMKRESPVGVPSEIGQECNEIFLVIELMHSWKYRSFLFFKS